jgi:hypothetical protein
MASPRFTGNAPLVAQLQTITVGTYDNTSTYKLTIGNKVVSVVGSGGSAATTATALLAALNASTYPEFLEITWASGGSAIITGTANGTGLLKGKPFTVVESVTGGTGDFTSNVTTTAASGPNDVSLAQNWSTGVVLADTDSVYFDSGSTDVLYNLDQNAITPNAVYILPGFTGKIGLPLTNTDNTSVGGSYAEYRTTYLQYGNSGDATNIAVTIQSTSQRIKLNCGTSQATFNVLNGGQRPDPNVPNILLKSTHASSALTISKGDCGVAFFGGETSTLVTVNAGYQQNVTGDVQLYLGSGVTLTAPAIVQSGGTLSVNSAITSTSTVVINDGVYYQNGTGGIAAGLSVRGGRCVYNSTGTLGGAPVVSGSGIMDFSQDLRAKTVTNPIDCYGDKCSVLDPHKVVATLVLDLDEVKNTEKFDIGRNVRMTRGTPS